MSTEPVASLIEFNAAISLAILLVLAARKLVRRKLGAHGAYALWLLAPVAGIATFIPARVLLTGEAAFDISGGLAGVVDAAGQISWLTGVSSIAPWVWAGGAMVVLALQTWRQARFAVNVKRGQAGPAVVGFFQPRVVVPTDFRARYTPAERALILQHEMVHIARHDSRLNTLVVLVQCACWFNPLIHAAAHAMRIDQEMSCDAAVIARRPRARHPYAQALVKTQLAASPLPVGCYWPAGTQHPLKERIAMLAHARASISKRIVAAALVFGLSAAVGLGSWWAQPASAAPEPEQTFADFTGAKFDDQAPVLITGTISRVDAGNGGYLVHVSDTKSGKAWIVSGTSAGGFGVDDIRANIGKLVKIRGYQAANRVCNPACLASGRDISLIAPE